MATDNKAEALELLNSVISLASSVSAISKAAASSADDFAPPPVQEIKTASQQDVLNATKKKKPGPV